MSSSLLIVLVKRLRNIFTISQRNQGRWINFWMLPIKRVITSERRISSDRCMKFKIRKVVKECSINDDDSGMMTSKRIVQHHLSQSNWLKWLRWRSSVPEITDSVIMRFVLVNEHYMRSYAAWPSDEGILLV